MNRTSLVIALVVPSLLLACGAGENTVGTDWPDAGDAQDTNKASDSCTGCTAGAATLVLSAPEVCLSASVGQQSGVAVFDVTNTGNTASGPLTVTPSGFAAASFIITSDTCSGVALPPAARCKVSLVYAPVAAHANAESADLTVADAQTSVRAFLRGSDIGIVTVSPPALDFGEVAAGSSSDEFIVQITTTSFCGTTWTTDIDNQSFIVATDTCTGRVTTSCRIGVRLAPPVGPHPKAASGWLTVTASDSGSAMVALSGIITPGQATPGSLMVTPSVVDFGDVVVGASATATITVSGAKSSPMISIGGTGTSPVYAPFTTGTSTCKGTGETCTIPIKFAPKAAGPGSATLTVIDGQNAATVTLQGTGLAVSVTPRIVVTPAVLDFGKITVTETSKPVIVTVTTTTAGALKLSLSDSAAAEVSIVEESCTTEVPANGTCSISLTYKPAKVSKLNGTLNIIAETSVAAVTLAGEGWTLL